MLGLPCFLGFSLVVASGGYSLVVVHGLLMAVVSLVAEHGSRACGLQQLQHMGSGVVARGLWSTGSIFVAHGLFCSWHVGSSWIRDQTPVSCIGRQTLPLSHQGSPAQCLFCVNVASLNDRLSNTLSCFHKYLTVKILSVFRSFFHHQIGLTLYLINPCSLLTFRNSNKCQCLQGR